MNPGDSSVCVPLAGEQRFGVAEILDSTSEAGLVVRNDLSIREPGAIAVRMPEQRFFDWGFSRGPVVFAAISGIVLECFAEEVTRQTKQLCGLSAIAAITSALFAVWELRAMGQRPVGGRLTIEASENPYYKAFGMLEDTTAIDNIIEGKHTTFSKILGNHVEEYTHIQLLVEIQDVSSGDVQSSVVDFDTATNRTLISAQAPLGNAGSKSKRQSPQDFTAYYSYDQLDQFADDFFPIREETADRLAELVWDEMHDTESGGLCGALAIPNFDGIVQPVNRGYWALISGAFADELTSCPNP